MTKKHSKNKKKYTNKELIDELLALEGNTQALEMWIIRHSKELNDAFFFALNNTIEKLEITNLQQSAHLKLMNILIGKRKDSIANFPKLPIRLFHLAEDVLSGNKTIEEAMQKAKKIKPSQIEITNLSDYLNRQNPRSQQTYILARLLLSITNFIKDLELKSYSLGICAYILSNHTQTIDEAISIYEKALTIFRKLKEKENIGAILNNLALAYYNLPTGNRTENLKQAIKYYEEALKIHIKEEFPVDYARVMNNLANAYCELPTGDRTENLKKAIEYYEESLQIRTKEEFPFDYARTINNLALAYSDLPTGDRAENLKKAIEYYEESLKICVKEEFSSDYARTINNLALAYFNLPTGDRTENLKKAIKYYEKSLKIFAKEEFPVDYARTINNLASAYYNLSTGDRIENLKKAIKYYEKSLKIRTKEEFPFDYASTINNLALAYSDLPTDNRTENLKKAIKYYEEALTILTKKEFPFDYAGTINNLANTYFKLPTGDHTENLKKAIKCYEETLKIVTEKSFPNDYTNSIQGLTKAIKKLPLNERIATLEELLSSHHISIISNIEAKNNGLVNHHCGILLYLLEQNKEILDAEKTTDSLYKLGLLLLKNSFWQKSAEAFLMSINSFPEIEDVKAKSFLKLGEIYNEERNLELARWYFKDAIRLFNRLGDMKNLAFAKANLGIIEIQIGLHKEAIEDWKTAKNIFDELHLIEKSQKMQELLSVAMGG